MDCFGIAIINGLDPRAIKPGTKLKASIFFAIIHFLMLYAGFYLGGILENYISKDHYHLAALVILVFVGIKMITTNLKSNPVSKAFNINKIKVILGLSFATSIDTIIAGLSIPFLLVDINIMAIMLSFIVFVLTFIGLHSGRDLGLFFGKKAAIMGGIMIIGAGIANLLPVLFLY